MISNNQYHDSFSFLNFIETIYSAATNSEATNKYNLDRVCGLEFESLKTNENRQKICQIWHFSTTCQLQIFNLSTINQTERKNKHKSPDLPQYFLRVLYKATKPHGIIYFLRSTQNILQITEANKNKSPQDINYYYLWVDLMHVITTDVETFRGTKIWWGNSKFEKFWMQNLNSCSDALDFTGMIIRPMSLRREADSSANL